MQIKAPQDAAYGHPRIDPYALGTIRHRGQPICRRALGKAC
jgi:hypothetical protein